MIYPTKDNDTKSWFIKDGFQNDKRVRLDEKVLGNGTDGYRLDDNSKVRFSVSAIEDKDIGCSGNFADRVKRGYTYKSSDWKNVEMTAFYKLTHAGPKDNSIIMKGPTGEHHSNTDCCTGSAEQLRILLTDPAKTEFAKEMWHVNYTTKKANTAIPGIDGKSVFELGWFGVKYIRYLSQDKKTVKLEIWWNQNGDKQSWKKINSITDGGGWGDRGDKCGGAKDQIHLWGNARMMWRWDFRDGSDIKFKWNSIREIDPFKTFDDKPNDPVNPPTSTPDITFFRSTLKIQRDMNYNFAVCEPPGEQLFWSFTYDGDDELQIERGLCNHANHSNRTILGQRAGSGSGLLGHIPKRVEFLVAQRGTPTGTCRAKIWDLNGVEKFASPTINVNTLPTEFFTGGEGPPELVSFDFDANTRIIQTGDRIGVQYTGTDPSNYIAMSARDPGDGSTATHYVYYDGTWDLGFTGRDCYFKAYEDT